MLLLLFNLMVFRYLFWHSNKIISLIYDKQWYYFYATLIFHLYLNDTQSLYGGYTLFCDKINNEKPDTHISNTYLGNSKIPSSQKFVFLVFTFLKTLIFTTFRRVLRNISMFSFCYCGAICI